jgi:hypothetical protein
MALGLACSFATTCSDKVHQRRVGFLPPLANTHATWMLLSGYWLADLRSVTYDKAICFAHAMAVLLVCIQDWIPADNSLILILLKHVMPLKQPANSARMLGFYV